MPNELLNDDGSLDQAAASSALDDYGMPSTEVADDNKQETKETKAVEDDVKSVNDDDATMSTDDGEDWVSRSDIRELMESLDLPESVVKQMSGPDELQRHARFLDQQLIREGRKPGEDQETVLKNQEEAERREVARKRAESQERDENGNFVKGEDHPLVKALTEKLDTDFLDDGLVEGVKQIGDYVVKLESRIDEMTQERANEQQQGFAQEFERIVDNLGHPDIFGEGDIQPGSDEWNNRSKLWDQTAGLVEGMLRRGKQASLSSIIKRALNAEFSDELSTKQRRDITQKVQRQAGKKLGGAGQRVANEENQEWDGDNDKDPYLLRAFDQIRREYGVK